MPLTSIVSRISRRIEHDRALAALATDLERVFATRVPRRGGGPTVGFASFGSGEWHLAFELLLAHALEQRGARPSLLICDVPDLPICSERLVTSVAQHRCDGCLATKRELLDIAGIAWDGVSTFVGGDTIARAGAIAAAIAPERIEEHVERCFPVGRWLHVSASNFLRCDARGDTADKVAVRRRLLATAIVGVEAVEKWLDRLQPDVVVVQSGAHTLWRIAREAAGARGLPVISRELGKGGWDRQIFALNRDAMAPDLDDAWRIARDMPLSALENAEVDALASTLTTDTYLPVETTRRQHPGLTIDPAARIAVAFTNVTWDLATADRDVAFNGVFDWLTATMRALRGRDGVQLIVRAHPAEASVMTRERVLDRIAAEWPADARVTVVPPEHPITARELCGRADLVLAYNSTAGLEAALHGKPVVVCGDPHFRGRGFTTDVETREQYQELLGHWSRNGFRPPEASAELARRYFHLFYARYHVPMGWMTSPLEPPYRLLIRSGGELAPGCNRSVDLVCDGILHARQILRPRAGEDASWRQ